MGKDPGRGINPSDAHSFIHSFIHKTAESSSPTRVSFILPCYKKNEAPVENMETTASIPLSQLWSRAAQISPELDPGPIDRAAAAAVVVEKFPDIAHRRLNMAGQCKVLVVDDSKMSNRILVKIIHQIPIDCSDLSDGDDEGVGLVPLDMGGISLRGRSSYRQLDEGPGPQQAAVYSIEEADDGTVAVEKVRQASVAGFPFDIVFMDNIMIRMNGPEAAQLMRSGGYRGLIVGVTGNVMEKDVADYLASGADCVLGKPVNTEELTQILQRFK